MTTVEDKLRQFYANFAAGRFTAVRNQLAGRVMYLALSSDHGAGSARGPKAVARSLEEWHRYFKDLELGTNLFLRQHPERVGGMADARYCFEVRYSIIGSYAKTLPGLESIAPASGRMSGLAVTDWVWLTAEGKIVRINNSYKYGALH